MARAMKDSGIEWIGEIPEGWETVRFKYLHTGLNTGEAIDKEYWTTNEGDTPFYTAGLVPIRTSYTCFPQWKYTSENDLLLARNGTPYVYFPVVGACYTDHIIRAPLKAGLNRRFIQYGLQQSISSVVVDSVSIATWSASLWNKQALAWPPYEEQARIVSFLDSECARIDAVIEQTRASIEEYKKLKQSVITQAVTKGIRPGRKMKDSGVPWLSQIPDEWEMQRGKCLFTEVDNRSEDGTEELLTVSQYTGVTPRSQKNVSMFEAETLEGYKICEVGDIAANTMWLWAGAIGVSTYKGVISPSYNIYRQKMGRYDLSFLDYLLRADPLVQHFESLSTGIRASRLRLYPQQFLSIFYPVPPIDEQKEIVDYLKDKIREMNHLIEKKDQFHSELESYKKSLIYEYVTGKKEVLHQPETLAISFVDMRALLMCRIVELMEPKGRIHLQKALYTIDCLSGTNDQTQYVRQTHGPYDTRIEEYESAMVKHGWATAKPGTSVEYGLGKNYAEYRELYQRYCRGLDPLVEKICIFLKPMRTSQAGRVATLLAAWNDFLLDGVSPTDAMIIQEVRNHWTPNKAHSEEETWFDTLRKIKDNDLIPKGVGLHTIPKAEG